MPEDGAEVAEATAEELAELGLPFSPAQPELSMWKRLDHWKVAGSLSMVIARP